MQELIALRQGSGVVGATAVGLGGGVGEGFGGVQMGRRGLAVVTERSLGGEDQTNPAGAAGEGAPGGKGAPGVPGVSVEESAGGASEVGEQGRTLAAGAGAKAVVPAGRRFRMTVAYDGSGFHGWQRQEPPGGEPLRTVAGELEGVISRVMRRPVTVVGASRTDAGVHARGQVGAFTVDSPIPTERMERAINSRLPPDLEIRDLAEVDGSFHPIRDAVCKQYRYRIHHAMHRPLEKRAFVWHCWYSLDTRRMAEAAARLVGTHDFAGFAQAHHGRLTTVRTVLECRLEFEAPEIHLVVVGDGFLYNMVRIIAGTVVEAGRGRLSLEQIDRALETGDRRLAGPTLPPEGLWLEWIRYG